jgi:hypothetical protein
MITGIFLGFMSFVSIAMTWLKMPEPVQKFACKHELLTDFGFGLLIWGILGWLSKTIAAVIGATIAEILLAVGLHWWRKHKGW